MAKGKHVPSSVPGQGPQDAYGKVAGHVTGRGGSKLPGPSAGDPDGDGDNDRTVAGRADDATQPSTVPGGSAAMAMRGGGTP
jgi:hypothetical protein